MDVWSKDVQGEKFSSQFTCNRCYMLTPVLMDMFSTKCRIFCFYKFPVIFIKKVKTLLDGHWVRMNFSYILQGNPWVNKQVLINLQVYFPHYSQVRLLQKVVVCKNTTCN